jgi:hypothetical protein
MKKVIYGVLFSLPAFAFAADFTPLYDMLAFIGVAIKSLIPIVFGLALVYFFWGLAMYIRAAGDPKKANEGKSIMVYGVIAIAVMISVYGIVAFLQDIFGITQNGSLPVPEVQGLP